MKRLTTTAVATLLLTLSLFAAGAGARTSGYSCTYKQSSVPFWTRLSGEDLTPSLCQIYQSSLRATRVAYPRGRMACRFVARRFLMFITVYTTSYSGEIYCSTLARESRKDFTRVF